MTLSLTLRVTAGLAWRTCLGVLATSVAWFLTTLNNARLKAPSNPWEFVATWGPRVGDDEDLAGRARLAGRLGMVSPQHAERAYQGALDWEKAGRPRPYSSLGQLATECAPWREVMEETGVTAGTVLRAVRKAHPGFGYVMLRPRPKLTSANRDARLGAAYAGADLTSRELELTVFIDAKTFFAEPPTGARGWVDVSKDRTCPALPAVKHKGRGMKACVYGAVNALLGPVLLVFVTGTAGLDGGFKGKVYKVGSHAPQHGGLAGCRMAHGLTQLGSPPGSARALSLATPGVQPQHAKAGCLCSSRQCLVAQPPSKHAVVWAVCPSVKLASVLLPLHLNQKVGWRERHHVPPVPARLHRAAVGRAHALRADQRVRLACKQPHPFLACKQCVERALMAAALPLAHAAHKTAPARRALHPHKATVMRRAAPAAERLLVCGVGSLASERHVVHATYPAGCCLLFKLLPRPPAPLLPAAGRRRAFATCRPARARRRRRPHRRRQVR